MAYKDPEVRRQKAAEYRERNREKRREWDRQHYQRHREQRLAASKERKKRNAEHVARYNTAYARKRRQQDRAAIFALLGTTCVRCGFSDTRALQFDHINGGGTQERKGVRSMDAYYKAIIAGGGVGFQVLCANCNSIKRHEGDENRRPR